LAQAATLTVKAPLAFAAARAHRSGWVALNEALKPMKASVPALDRKDAWQALWVYLLRK